ncbi:hypothetical protein BD779DRAFT_1809222 [Infundibulicybe gibba]|nr:hypothetical protein BD779DRAFT_1809222 [Infundibulicybe gibba]
MSDNSADRPGLPITEKTGPSSRPAAAGNEPPPPRIWRSGQPFLHKLPKSGGDHWKECKEKVDQFDKDFYAGWISEVDSLPTFAGLFSAVVTSFTIESYKLLQPDPQDATNQILLNISAQLAGQNVTASVPPLFSPSASSIRINIFWFLSLILSLGAGLLGIVCKQWLQRYKRDISLSSPKHDLALRQLRYDGFVQWGVVDIMGALPLLL